MNGREVGLESMRRKLENIRTRSRYKNYEKEMRKYKGREEGFETTRKRLESVWKRNGICLRSGARLAQPACQDPHPGRREEKPRHNGTITRAFRRA